MQLSEMHGTGQFSQSTSSWMFESVLSTRYKMKAAAYFYLNFFDICGTPIGIDNSDLEVLFF